EQNPIVNCAGLRDGQPVEHRIKWGQQKSSVERARYDDLLARIAPRTTIELAERDAPPLKVERAASIAIDLYVHDHGIGLLNLANPPKLYLVAEAGCQFASRRVGAEVSG